MTDRWIETHDDLSHEGRELALYMEHGGREVFYAYLVPAMRNLHRHWRKDRFNLDLGIKGMRHAVDRAAKAYNREHGGFSGPPWHKLFSVKDRDQVAEFFARSFVSDVRDGEIWWEDES